VTTAPFPLSVRVDLLFERIPLHKIERRVIARVFDDPTTGKVGVQVNGGGLTLLQLQNAVNALFRHRHRIVTGILLSSIGVVLFMLTRQPYAGFIYFALLAIKVFLAAKGR